eukprot:PLAT10367.1.p1 GENE.PLAT10367.1~~PLAT10367.1.p1  ORF type:complete len:723 (-),score=420.00 PLAT10367.1:102-2270(-)
MGNKGSSISGKAAPDARLLNFTTWENREVTAMLGRFRAMGSEFALTLRAFGRLLNLGAEEASELFHAVFDTDENGLVDAYEVLGGIAMCSSMEIREKVNFVHALYDFNGSGDLTMDEMTILMRTLVCGLAKMDAKVAVPRLAVVEALSAAAFSAADRDADGEISKTEFDAWVQQTAHVKQFVDYWDGGVRKIPIAEGTLWEDADFPCSGDSLYRDGMMPPCGAPPAHTVRWLRPAEICPGEPQLFIGGLGSADVIQGQLGDCWFLSALSVMASRPELLHQLFVTTGQEAQGRYCVQFFKDGDWRQVFIDDRIPCDSMGKPLYADCKDPNEMWVLLVEKAYAKLHGCYQSLVGGFADYGLQDMTGGAPAKIDLRSRKVAAAVKDGTLWGMLKDNQATGLLGAAHRLIGKGGHHESHHSQGILAGHAYSVLRLEEVGEHRLVKCRNPWGMREWSGDWADGDVMWEDFPDTEAALGYVPENDGTFWMSFADFCSVFNTIYTCRLFDDDWCVQRREGGWAVDSTAGGCPNFRTWVKNEQFSLVVEEETNVLISISQPDNRYHKPRSPVWNTYDNAIGFFVARHGDSKRPLMRLTRDAVVAMSPSFKAHRSVGTFAVLAPGRYVIVPSSFKPGEAGTFTLSVYGNNEFNMEGGAAVKWEGELEEEEGGENDLGEMEEVQDDEPAEEEQDLEEVALQSLHQLVARMWKAASLLKKRKAALEARLDALL